jgi:sigma-E factor negative regulatory protein RseA
MTAQPQMRDDQEPIAWEASVSAWVDGESDIRADELDSPYGRQVWDTYHLIGDVLRNEELAIKPSDMFYARLSRAIDDEPAIVAPAPLRKRSAVRLGLSGLAVAAAVATVVWVALPYVTHNGAPTVAPAVLASTDDPSLQPYLQAHRDLAGVGAGALRQASFEVRK